MLSTLEATIFVKKTVGELLFEGYEDTVMELGATLGDESEDYYDDFDSDDFDDSADNSDDNSDEDSDEDSDASDDEDDLGGEGDGSDEEDIGGEGDGDASEEGVMEHGQDYLDGWGWGWTGKDGSPMPTAGMFIFHAT